MKKSVSKSEAVKQYLLKKKSITSWEAIEKLKVTRLSAIIFNLRKSGWKINNKSFKNENSNFVKYILIKSK